MSDITHYSVDWRLCPQCGCSWPHPKNEHATPEHLIDYTCAVCLHARIAELQRALTFIRSRIDTAEDAC